MDGRFIDGYAIEVSYKPSVPIPQNIFNVSTPGTYHLPSPETPIDYPTMPMYVPPRNMWPSPPGPNPLNAPPLPPNPPQPPPNPNMLQFPSAPVMDGVPCRLPTSP